MIGPINNPENSFWKEYYLVDGEPEDKELMRVDFVSTHAIKPEFLIFFVLDTRYLSSQPLEGWGLWVRR
jgi:hypothetical protein